MKPVPIRTTLAAAIVAVFAFAALASSALAATPAPGYGQFAGCPSPAENPAVESCIHAEITGGHFNMGNKSVPIKKPMVLSGGTTGFFENFTNNSSGGLTPVKQLVPGGVIGLTGLDWLVNFLNVEALQLYAVTELAGTPNVQNVFGPVLPIKVHLINPALGNNCYVGSTSNPIVLHLTTGTTSPPPPNTPITGVNPTVSFNAEKEILSLTNGTYVDNAFAAPGASGCVLTLFGFIPISINGLVNSASGLPAPAGTNETVQTQTTEIAARFLVYP